LTDQQRDLQAESCVGSAYPAQVVHDRPNGRDPDPHDLAKLCGVEQRAPPIFGSAAIAFGIGPHFYSF